MQASLPMRDSSRTPRRSKTAACRSLPAASARKAAAAALPPEARTRGLSSCSALRWSRFSDHGAVALGDHQDREPLHVVELVGAERRIVEASAYVRIAVLVELHSSIGRPRVHLHV